FSSTFPLFSPTISSTFHLPHTTLTPQIFHLPPTLPLSLSSVYFFPPLLHFLSPLSHFLSFLLISLPISLFCAFLSPILPSLPSYVYLLSFNLSTFSHFYRFIHIHYYPIFSLPHVFLSSSLHVLSLTTSLFLSSSLRTLLYSTFYVYSLLSLSLTSTLFLSSSLPPSLPYVSFPPPSLYFYIISLLYLFHLLFLLRLFLFIYNPSLLFCVISTLLIPPRLSPHTISPFYDYFSPHLFSTLSPLYVIFSPFYLACTLIYLYSFSTLSLPSPLFLSPSLTSTLFLSPSLPFYVISLLISSTISLLTSTLYYSTMASYIYFSLVYVISLLISSFCVTFSSPLTFCVISITTLSPSRVISLLPWILLPSTSLPSCVISSPDALPSTGYLPLLISSAYSILPFTKVISLTYLHLHHSTNYYSYNTTYIHLTENYYELFLSSSLPRFLPLRYFSPHLFHSLPSTLFFSPHLSLLRYLLSISHFCVILSPHLFHSSTSTLFLSPSLTFLSIFLFPISPSTLIFSPSLSFYVISLPISHFYVISLLSLTSTLFLSSSLPPFSPFYVILSTHLSPSTVIFSPHLSLLLYFSPHLSPLLRYYFFSHLLHLLLSLLRYISLLLSIHLLSLLRYLSHPSTFSPFYVISLPISPFYVISLPHLSLLRYLSPHLFHLLSLLRYFSPHLSPSMLFYSPLILSLLLISLPISLHSKLIFLSLPITLIFLLFFFSLISHSTLFLSIHLLHRSSSLLTYISFLSILLTSTSFLSLSLILLLKSISPHLFHVLIPFINVISIFTQSLTSTDYFYSSSHLTLHFTAPIFLSFPFPLVIPQVSLPEVPGSSP
ncbi:hypothetical protein C7M84_017877, partial [Penaeus vannamei]